MHDSEGIVGLRLDSMADLVSVAVTASSFVGLPRGVEEISGVVSTGKPLLGSDTG